MIALNDISLISENRVWLQVLRARKKPEHFRVDYPVSMGLKGTSRTSAVFRSGLRLARETLELVRREFGEKAKHSRFKALLKEQIRDYPLFRN